MDTDHTSYSIVYACNEIFGYKFETKWIISRTPNMNEDKLKELDAKAIKLTGYKEPVKKTLQQGCTYP